MTPLNCLLVLGLLLSACADPKCPRNLIQDGMTCLKCPDGGTANNNKCVPGDAGVTYDSADEDPNSQDDSDSLDPESREDATTTSSSSTATALEPGVVGVGDAATMQAPAAASDAAPDDTHCGAATSPKGAACSNGLLGACKKEGVLSCQSGMMVCAAASVAPSPETCGDQVDNDCDGKVDEADAVDALTWFPDCDGDGYTPSVLGSVKGCTKPEAAGNCRSWTNIVPSEQTKTNWDCDDSRTEYAPGVGYGFPPSGASSYDLNCDGSATPDPVFPVQPLHQQCLSSFIDKLNANPDYCASGSCYAWRNGSTWSRTPTNACPDTAYAIGLNEGLGTCVQVPRTQPLYPCR